MIINKPRKRIILVKRHRYILPEGYKVCMEVSRQNPDKFRKFIGDPKNAPKLCKMKHHRQIAKKLVVREDYTKQWSTIGIC